METELRTEHASRLFIRAHVVKCNEQRELSYPALLFNMAAASSSPMLPEEMLFAGPHERFPAMSSALKIVHTPQRGRHIVAMKDIPAGLEEKVK